MAISVKKQLALAIAMFLLVCMNQEELGIRGCGATGGVNHVVGGDPGWGADSNIAAWSVNKVFRVGDNIWFTYAAAESIAELKSKEDFESCELDNPIRMYSEGLNRIHLDEEGSHYFVSANPESCKNGLKLHVKVKPHMQESLPVTGQKNDVVAVVVAEAPTPSGSQFLQVSPVVLAAVMALASLLCFTGL